MALIDYDYSPGNGRIPISSNPADRWTDNALVAQAKESSLDASVVCTVLSKAWMGHPAGTKIIINEVKKTCHIMQDSQAVLEANARAARIR